MRKLVLLAGLSSLAACGGGGGTNSAGSGPPPTGPGTGPVGSTHSFVKPTEVKTYQSQSAVQSYRYDYTENLSYTKRQVFNADGTPVLNDRGNPTYELVPESRTLTGDYHGGQLYSADASTVRSPGVTVTYDPRNAQFTLLVNQNGVSKNIRFQDPAHRTDFENTRRPQDGVPNVAGLRYLEVDSGSTTDTTDLTTFFYELPGTTTQYVTYAGFVRNRVEGSKETIIDDRLQARDTRIARTTLRERGAFIFGEQTDPGAVPKTGTGAYNGNMLASMIFNPTFDDPNPQSSYFQWIAGTARVNVDFAAGTVATDLRGTVLAPLFDRRPNVDPTTIPNGYPDPFVTVPGGSIFTASSLARIDLVKTGGFTGTFSKAEFSNGSKVTIEGSTIDGAFYGPKAQEVGATFRIVGGVPDQRVDIIGALTGKSGQ